MAEDGPLSQADIDALTAGLLGNAAAPALDANALRPDAEVILEQASAVLGTLLNRHASLAAREMRLRIRQSAGIADTIAAPELAPPELLWPEDGALGVYTLVGLSWKHGSVLRPPPLAELRFGLANPPPMVDSNLAGPPSGRFRTRPDTEYFWQVVSVRAGARSASPVRRFRTRVLPPSSLGYPEADSVYHVGTAKTLIQEYAGGRARFASEPPLPPGFALDTLTGRIDALPDAESGPGEYRILALNEAGSAETLLRFRVDSRLHKLAINDSLKQGDSLSVHATEPSGAFLRSLWDGPVPADPALDWSRGHDDGSEIHIVFRSFREGTLLLEIRYRMLGDDVDRLPPALPGAPRSPSPASGALDQDTLLALSWAQDSLPGPAPLWRLRFGFVDPPPLFRDSLREPGAGLPPLLADTLYRWSVSALRAGVETPGPVWSFRTRPAAPRSLAYPPDSVLHVGMPVMLAPEYDGGTRARYRVQPPLPAGLALDSLTGRISGAPADTAPSAVHTVTAANVSGSALAAIRLRVDGRLVRITLPVAARAGDSAVARLLDAGGGAVDTLWDGPLPDDLRVGSPTPRYDGSEGGAQVLVFRRGVLVREYAYVVRGPLASAETRPLGILPAPASLSPAETTQTADTALHLVWQSAVSDPPPLSRIYLGTAFPLPLFADSVRGDSLRVAGLSPDTRYYWRVETLRAGRSAMGPLTGFRTRPGPPLSLAYPVTDTLLPLAK